MATRKRAARKSEQPTTTPDLEPNPSDAAEIAVSDKPATEPPAGTNGSMTELVSSQQLPEPTAEPSTPRNGSWADSVRHEGRSPEGPAGSSSTRKAARQEQPPSWTPPPVRVIKTVDLEGYKITLQQKPKRFDEKTQKMYPRQMQIKFGDGSPQSKPSDDVIDAIKSYKVSIDTPEGPKERQMFHFDGEQRAWGISLSYKDNDEASKSARVQAEIVYDQVVKMVAQEIGAGQNR